MDEVKTQDQVFNKEVQDKEEVVFEESIRPNNFSEYIGQNHVTENLKLFIQAALERNDALDHCLFSGPPGLGKTTLAYIVAKMMGSQLHVISAPSLDKKGDLAAILSNLQKNDVLFIDEIHRLPKVIEEVLYSAMEDFSIDIILGQGPSARTLRIDLPKFTLIGATTRTGLLSTPLRTRFGIPFQLEFYNSQDLQNILLRSARILKVEIEDDAAFEIARRSRGTPRIANRLLKRARDFAQVLGKGIITKQIASDSLFKLEVDELGLDSMDRKILTTIIEKFDGGPVGVETLCASLSEEKDTIEEVYEPYLLQEGFLQRTSRGRVATKKAYEHLKIKFKNDYLF